MATNAEIFAAVWPSIAPKWAERIPADSQGDWRKIGVLISSEKYEALKNEIYDALVNLIGKTKVWHMSITNPLSRFKSGEMSYGDTYQEIMSDVIEGQTFKIAEDDQFKKWQHKVYSAYHRINREQFYPVTIEETKINRAFRAEGGLQSLVNSIVNQMYSSNNLDEFIYTKKLMEAYYAGKDIPVKGSQKVLVPEVVDRSTGNEFILQAKDVMSAMRFPNRDFNPLGIMMQTEPSQYLIIMRATLHNRIQVETLTGAFHNEYLKPDVPITTIDEFPEGMEKVRAVICDAQWLRIFDTLRRLKMAENARNLYRNYYYHVHQLYAASPFVNCVFLEVE